MTMPGDLELLVSILYLMSYNWEPEASGQWTRLYFLSIAVPVAIKQHKSLIFTSRISRSLHLSFVNACHSARFCQ